MRYTGRYAQAQKREERAIFQCYFRAINEAHKDSHRENLRLVRENMIEGDNDLTIDVWKNFLNVCEELRIDVAPITDIVKINKEHPGKGNGYRIPRKEKDQIGYLKKLQRRREWRELFRNEFGFENSVVLNKLHERPQLRVVQSRVG